MKYVSNDFKRTMERRRDFYCTADIVFLDGTKKQLKKSDFVLSGNSYSEGASSNSIPLGIVASRKIELSLMNYDDRWSEYDFYMAKITVKTNFDLDSGLTESINVGTFTIVTPESYGTTVGLSAVDDSYKLDKDYSTNLKYPISVGSAVRDSCSACGVSLLTTTFTNSTFVIKKKPDNLTHRQFIGLCAMIAGGNAVFDEYNRLKIKNYDTSVFEESNLDGGYFDKLDKNRYLSGDSADGGHFNPWNTGQTIDGGKFTDMNDIHILYEFKSLTVDTDDVVITGIKLTSKDKKEYLYGKEGYVLSLENQLVSGQESEAATLIGKQIVGMTFRAFKADNIAYPLAQFMDAAVIIDRKQNEYHSIITDINFSFYGFTTLKCSADSPVRNSSKYYGSAAKAIIKARENTEEMISDYDKAVQTLTNLITQSFGVFKTEEVQADGSVIYYMHNKPTKGASSTIWKMTADAFAVSTDGGKTWRAGMDSSGNAVVNVLSAIGIRFDWAKGGTLTLGGSGNVNGVLKILNASGKQIGKWDNTGINATNGTFSGSLEGATGTFKGELSAATGTFSGEITAKSGSIGGYTIDSQYLYSGGVGMSSSGGRYAFWAGETNGEHGGPYSNAVFKVGANGDLVAQSATISGNINATSGTFDYVTITNSSVSSSSLSGSAGDISGGSYWSPYLSRGSVDGTGGSYTGACSGSPLYSCSTNGTNLGVADGSITSSGSHATLYGGVGARLSGSSGYISVTGSAFVSASLTIANDLAVRGTKNRVITTEHFGERCLDALETPKAYFADCGVAALDENGECYIFIDPVFAETVNSDYMPIVFLTKYGKGELFMDYEQTTHDKIVVCGTPGLRFSWETRYQQANSYHERLRPWVKEEETLNGRDYSLEANIDYKDNAKDYAFLSAQYIDGYNRTSIDYSFEGAKYYEAYERSLIAS